MGVEEQNNNGSDLDLDFEEDGTEEEQDDLELDEEAFKAKTRDDWLKLEGKLKRARREAKNLRIRLNKEREGEDDTQTVEERKKAQELTKWQERAVRQSAKAALVEKGADSEFIDLLVTKLKINEIEFDDDEPLLDDWLDEMEEKYPKVFQPVQPKRRVVPSVDQGSGAPDKPAKPKMRYGDQVIAAAARVYGNPRKRR